MKLLLFSDLHTDRKATASLVQRAQSADVLIGAGDFGNERHGLNICIDILRAVDRPTVLVAGNGETTEELRAACAGWPSAHVLHGTGVTIANTTFFGVGGAVPITPFGAWSYDFTEDQARTLLAGCPNSCVLVTHSPPIGAVDVSSRGRSYGSEAIRETIERVKPLLVVCGHIHASAGQQTVIGPTVVVNAGPNGVDWTIEKSS